MKPVFRFPLLIIFSLLVFSCTSRFQAIPLQIIYSSNNCAISEQMLIPINSVNELEQLFKSFPKTWLKPPAISIQVDYQKQDLILFATGQKTSGGYDIRLDKKVATLEGKKLFLPIRIQLPDKNKFQPQLITSPCKIFAIPKTEFSELGIALLN